MENKNNSNIYRITEDIEKLQRKYIEDDSELLSVGLFGYLGDQFATIIQDNIFMTAEWGNEAFPTRAKFEKTILANAVNYNISNINATPAKMDVRIGISKYELDSVLNRINKDSYTISSDTEMSANGLTFRLMYDMRIFRKVKSSGETIYYAINTNDDEVNYANPYLPAPVFIDYSGESHIMFSNTLYQMDKTVITRKIISNSILDNKVMDFKFYDQLYKFDVKVIEPEGDVVRLTPLFENEQATSNVRFCNYYYTTPDSIRIRFAPNSYMPPINSTVEVTLYTTQGTTGNFYYEDEILFTSKNSGTILRGVVLSTGENYGGIDKKSIKELKNIIPKERLSRGILSNNRDLENYFNVLDENSRIKFFRKRHNQLERCYYSYLLVKNKNQNIVPTNTVDVNLSSELFGYEDDESYILPANTPMLLRGEQECRLVRVPDLETAKILEKGGFLYTTPFIISINKKPLYTSYYLNNIDTVHDVEYKYINTDNEDQYIVSKLQLYKNNIYDNYHYYIKMNLKSNIDSSFFTINDDGTTGDCFIKPILVIVKDGFNYYVEGEIIADRHMLNEVDRVNYYAQFTLNTNNIIKEGIKIYDVYQYGTKTKVDVELPNKVNFEVLLYSDKEGVVPNSNIHSVVNDDYMDKALICRVKTRELVDLFYDYTDIINSTSVVNSEITDNVYDFTVKAVPVVKFSYMQDKIKSDEFISYIHKRKKYIDEALLLLENNFTIDFKFFNTYGPSRMFKIGRMGEYINKLNISLKFIYRQKPGANSAIVDLMTDAAKEYVENINSVNTIHVMNLITYLKDKFSSDIDYIEFVGINDYDASYQLIEKREEKILDVTPEFINIDLDDRGNPAIEFKLVD